MNTYLASVGSLYARRSATILCSVRRQQKSVWLCLQLKVPCTTSSKEARCNTSQDAPLVQLQALGPLCPHTDRLRYALGPLSPKRSYPWLCRCVVGGEEGRESNQKPTAAKEERKGEEKQELAHLPMLDFLPLFPSGIL